MSLRNSELCQPSAMVLGNLKKKKEILKQSRQRELGLARRRQGHSSDKVKSKPGITGEIGRPGAFGTGG